MRETQLWVSPLTSTYCSVVTCTVVGSRREPEAVLELEAFHSLP